MSQERGDGGVHGEARQNGTGSPDGVDATTHPHVGEGAVAGASSGNEGSGQATDASSDTTPTDSPEHEMPPGSPGREQAPGIDVPGNSNQSEIDQILAAARTDPDQPRRIEVSTSREQKKQPWWSRFVRRRRPATLDEVVLADHDLDVRLKSVVANWSVGAMVGQLAVADTVFVLYAWLGLAWNVEPEVILGWLSATVVEVIAIVVIVARYLFPKDGHVWSRPPAFSRAAAPPERETSEMGVGDPAVYGQETEDKLRRLFDLRADEVLTEDEYTAAKRKVLGL